MDGTPSPPPLPPPRRPSSFEYNSSVVSNSSSGGNRRPSLREMPSFRDEACQALNRREDLQSLKERLAVSRQILHAADPASKPWLKMSSLQRTQLPSLRRGVVEPAASPQQQSPPPLIAGSVLAPPVFGATAGGRVRNLSRGTTGSGDSSEGSNSTFEY